VQVDSHHKCKYTTNELQTHVKAKRKMKASMPIKKNRPEEKPVENSQSRSNLEIESAKRQNEKLTT